MAHSATHYGTIVTGAGPCTTNGPSHLIELRLDPREVRKLDGNLCGTQILCAGGVLWLTQHEDPDDYILRPGDRFRVTRPGPVVIQGMRDC